MARYGAKAKETGAKAMRDRKRGTLKSGRSGITAKSRKPAIASAVDRLRDTLMALIAAPPPKRKRARSR